VMRIKEENEQLQDGKPVKAMSSDNHPLDIREHLVLLNSPEVRDDPNPNNPVKLAVTQHVLEHMNMWSQIDPRLAAATGIPPAPQPPAPKDPEEPKKSISFKDLPPDGQVQLAAQANIHLGQTGQTPLPGMPGQAPMTGNPGINTGRENPNGAKTPGVPNLSALAKVIPPGSAPQIQSPQAPKLPPGSPAINQEAAAKMATTTPHIPPMPSH